MKRAICWIRRDLRLTDHRALHQATEAAEGVAVVFIFDPAILDPLDRDDTRVNFIHQSLFEIDEKLKQRGSTLIVRHGNPVDLIPQLARELNAEAVFTAHDLEPAALERDRQVRQKLIEQGTEFRTCKDHLVRQKSEVLNQSNLPFRVYTPYSKVWKAVLDPTKDLVEYTPDLSKLISTAELANVLRSWTIQDIGFQPKDPWLKAGEDAAKDRLATFLPKIDAYGDQRDFPATEGTSYLSVDLRFGTISNRELFRQALSRDSKGAEKWLNELIWREFYADVLANNPQIVHTTFNPIYKDLEWPGTDEHFELWKAGQTGYPIVDAAMRCFKETGWMHNRLRMIVASFLTKDLLVDYKKGEAYFASKLLDFELASNSGGWQWASSVGVDAQPYFRIFNPYLQSVKFDSEGEFIKRWVPELAEVSGENLHRGESENYVKPIVDHFVQKDLAVRLLSTKTES
ncbi:MAG: deoxyribodipyrimidine photo-lyase [Fimbriimonas sp.]|nr:deoxyribodipyrimidine photo-lyase [Fimbriimonas sp.]